jgi:hypothetical protein
MLCDTNYLKNYVASRLKIVVWNMDCIWDVLSVIKLRGFSPQANYTDRATAACRRS